MKTLNLQEMENVQGWGLTKCEASVGFAFGIYCGLLAAGGDYYDY